MLDVVIVSYRCRDLLAACLESLERHPPARGLAVHVVDNASGDGTVEMVRSRFPSVQVHALSQNAGFSAANNLVLRETANPFVLLLNPDTEVTPGALDAALAALEAQPEAGMLGVRLVRPDGTFDHAAKRAFPTPLSALAHFTGVGRRERSGSTLAAYRMPDLDIEASGDVDAVNGAFMLVRRSAMDEVGLLDEGYWLYMEDLDWCARFAERGWRVRYEGGPVVVHHKSGSSGTRRAVRQEVAFHRGMGRFYRRHQAGSQPLLAPLVYAGIGFKLVIALVRRR